LALTLTQSAYAHTHPLRVRSGLADPLALEGRREDQHRASARYSIDAADLTQEVFERARIRHPHLQHVAVVAGHAVARLHGRQIVGWATGAGGLVTAHRRGHRGRWSITQAGIASQAVSAFRIAHAGQGWGGRLTHAARCL